jgi:hypothetical protein
MYKFQIPEAKFQINKFQIPEAKSQINKFQIPKGCPTLKFGI